MLRRPRLEKVRGVSFDVRAGEIVGIAGVDGNGQTELVEAITGLRKLESGTRQVGGTRVTHANARDRCSTPGVGHIPEDRHRRGLVLEFTIAENIALHDYGKPPDANGGWLFPRGMTDRARRLIKRVRRTRRQAAHEGRRRSRAATSRRSSLAREVARDPRVLIAAQPTRGLDVGAIEYLHRRLVEERDGGRAILLVSLELEEVLSLSDRILVMYEGEIVAEHRASVTEEEIGVEMLGGQRKAAA